MAAGDKGASFTITKHGHPVAELIPVRKSDTEKIRVAIEGLRLFRIVTVGGLSVREMIEEGRK